VDAGVEGTLDAAVVEVSNHSDALRPSHSLTRSLAGPRAPRAARVASLARARSPVS